LIYVTIIYCDGSATGRQADITVDGGTPQVFVPLLVPGVQGCGVKDDLPGRCAVG